MFLSAKRCIRAHPRWSDEDVAAYCGIHALDLDIVATARRDLGADAAPAKDPTQGAAWREL